MIDLDLERQLAPLVEGAPGTPPIDRVRAGVRRRRTRRRAFVTAAIAVVGLVAAVSVFAATRDHKASTITTNPTPAPSDSLRVTAPSGTEFTITGAPDLGLSKLSVKFYAQIRSLTLVPEFPTQEIVVQDVSAPTPHTCWFGYTYGRWRLLLACNSAAQDRRIHDLLDGTVNPDGFLVFNPGGLLRLGPTDSPDVELGDGAIGVFGPEVYPLACPIEAVGGRSTTAGLPALVDHTGAWWCDPAQEVRVHVADPARIDGALASLQVTVTPTVVTSLFGSTLRVDAPGIVLGRPIFQASVQSDASPFAGPPAIGVSQETPPAPVPGAATYPTADGHELYAARTGLGQDELAGTWDGWTVTVTADGLADSDRARLASLLRFAEHDGFLVLDPVAPLHAAGAPGPDIIFDGVFISTGSTATVCPTAASANTRTGEGLLAIRPPEDFETAMWCDLSQRLTIQVEQPASVDAALRDLRVTRVG